MVDTNRLQYRLGVSAREHVKRSETLLGYVHASDRLQFVQESGHCQRHSTATARERFQHVCQGTASVVHLCSKSNIISLLHIKSDHVKIVLIFFAVTHLNMV